MKALFTTNQPQTFTQQTPFANAPEFRFFTAFDPIDVFIQKQTVKIFRQLLQRGVEVQKVVLVKKQPHQYSVNGTSVYVDEIDGQVFVRIGSQKTRWAEWVYDQIVE